MDKILLLNLNWNKCEEFGAMTSQAIGLPLEFVYILSDLKDKDYPVTFIDLWSLQKEISDVADEIRGSKYIVVCSAPLYVLWRDGVVGIEFVKRGLKAIKKYNPDALLILIGPHGTVLPQTLFSPDLDFIIRGEPDLVICELIESIDKRRPYYPDGVCYRKNNAWAVSNNVAEIKDLNFLPALRYDLIDLTLYSYPVMPANCQGRGIATLYETSRGCIFDCVFCWRQGFRDRYRRKSVQRIKEEVGALKAKQVSYVYFIDEIFPIDSDWSNQVCHLFKACGINWGSETRAEFIVNDSIVNMISSTGCRLVQIGLETADAVCYEAAKKSKMVDLEKLSANIQKLKAGGVAVELFLVLGLPGDSEKAQLNMVRKLRSFPLDEVEIITNLAIPFPKTQLWDMGIAEGKALKSWTDMKAFTGIIANQFKDAAHLERSIAKNLAYLNFFRRVKIIKSRFKKRHRVSLKDILWLNYYVLMHTFPALNRLRLSVINFFKNRG